MHWRECLEYIAGNKNCQKEISEAIGGALLAVDIQRQQIDELRAGLHEVVKLSPVGLDLKEHLASLERELIKQALDRNNGVVARAADCLCLQRTTLVEKIRKYNLRKVNHESST